VRGDQPQRVHGSSDHAAQQSQPTSENAEEGGHRRDGRAALGTFGQCFFSELISEEAKTIDCMFKVGEFVAQAQGPSSHLGLRE
jgi:hypothetical protein